MPLVIGRQGVCDADGWSGAIKGCAFDGATHHQVVRAPAVVRSIAIGCQGTAKVGSCKGGDLIGYAEFHSGLIERRQGIVDLL